MEKSVRDLEFYVNGAEIIDAFEDTNATFRSIVPTNPEEDNKVYETVIAATLLQIPLKPVDMYEDKYLVHGKCPRCGARVYKSDVFCRECGQQIDWASTESDLPDAIKDLNNLYDMDVISKYLEKEYVLDAIGTLMAMETNNSDKIIIKTLARHVPVQPRDISCPVLTQGYCFMCRGELNKLGNRPTPVLEIENYCTDCGKKIDWTDISIKDGTK